MKSEQQFDLIAEAGWQVCVDGRLDAPGCIPLWSAGWCRHRVDGETDLGRGHYDTHINSPMIPVRECFRLDGEYVYQERE